MWLFSFRGLCKGSRLLSTSGQRSQSIICCSPALISGLESGSVCPGKITHESARFLASLPKGLQVFQFLSAHLSVLRFSSSGEGVAISSLFLGLFFSFIYFIVLVRIIFMEFLSLNHLCQVLASEEAFCSQNWRRFCPFFSLQKYQRTQKIIVGHVDLKICYQVDWTKENFEESWQMVFFRVSCVEWVANCDFMFLFRETICQQKNPEKLNKTQNL